MYITFVLPSGEREKQRAVHVPRRGDFVWLNGCQFRVSQVEWAPPLTVVVFLEDRDD